MVLRKKDSQWCFNVLQLSSDTAQQMFLITGRVCDVNEFIHTKLTASSSSVVPVSCWVRVHRKDGETRLADRWRHHFLFTLLPHRTDATNINLLSWLCPRRPEDRRRRQTDRKLE